MADSKYVSGVEALKRRISTIREKLQLPALIEPIGELLLKRTLTRFDREEDPSGNPWVPLQPSTIKRRMREGTGTKKLNATGAMRASIQVIRGGIVGAIFTNTGAGLRIGITDPRQALKGRVHNQGSKNVPQRRFLGVGPLDVRAVSGLMQRRAKKLDLIERN
jgi:phage gpG-like protein